MTKKIEYQQTQVTATRPTGITNPANYREANATRLSFVAFRCCVPRSPRQEDM